MPNQAGYNPMPSSVNVTDFTLFKYKQFTGIMSAAGGDVGQLYDAVCV